MEKRREYEIVCAWHPKPVLLGVVYTPNASAFCKPCGKWRTPEEGISRG